MPAIWSGSRISSGVYNGARTNLRKKISSPSKKILHISGFLDGFWTLWDDSGAGGSR